MRQDLLFSLLLHVVLLAAMVITAPFKPQYKPNLGDIIKVNLASLPPSFSRGAAKPAAIPAATTAEKKVTPLPNKAKAKPVEKTKPAKTENIKQKPAIEKDLENIPGTDNGKKDVSENLAPGSVFGSAAIDNSSFDYPYWFVQAFGKIERNWSNPVYANQPLTCIVYFQVIRSGRIIKIEIEQTSGIDTFDRACEQAIKTSEPLPPLPSEFTDEIIGIHLEFPYVPQ
jgi:TonB family protein